MRYALAAVAALVACAPAGAATYTYSFTVPTAITSQIAAGGFVDTFTLPTPVQLAAGDTIDLTFNFEAPQTFPLGAGYIGTRLANGDIAASAFGTATLNFIDPVGIGASLSNRPMSSPPSTLGATFPFLTGAGFPGFTISGIHTVYNVSAFTRAGPVTFSTAVIDVNAAVPEPAAWALMVLGFGFVGYASRKRRATFRLA